MELFKPKFKFDIIDNAKYNERLQYEIDTIEQLGYTNYILNIVDIYNNHISRHVNLLRGSAGSSLLLYYLGINKIDPVKYDIPFSRFLNKSRTSSPDIDIDLPTILRNEIIDEIINNNKNTIRMICTPLNTSDTMLDNLLIEDQNSYKLHNSGVIIYNNEQIDIVNKNKINNVPILKLTKNTIHNFNLKKIDLLANNAVGQLYLIDKNKHIDNYDFNDSKVFEFINQDDGIGIAYAETQTIQYVLKILKPQNIEQLSLVLALIRPFANKYINDEMTFETLKNEIIYDDDIITYLIKQIGCDEDKADKIRRIFKKRTDIDFINNFICNIPDKYKSLMLYSNKYSYCKAHSINYARLIYCLYYNKLYNTKKFWETCLMNNKGYYKDWVYIRKGLQYGLKFKGIETCDPFYHFLYTGYWVNKEFMSKCHLKILDTCDQNENNKDVKKCHFRGIIAGIGSMITNGYRTIITIGYDNDKFINLHSNKHIYIKNHKQISGYGYYIDGRKPYIQITKITMF